MQHILRCSGYELAKTDMVRGQGCYLYDINNNRYIDFEAGVWCTALGHSHERVNQTIRAQSARLMHVGYRYTTALVEDAAAAVLDTLALPDGKCIFLSSGSEAVEFGVQVARRVMEQPLLLTLAHSYLAAYGSAGQKNPDEWHCFDWEVCVACPRSTECDPQCVHLRGIPFDRIGGLVFEPGSTGGLVKFPPKPLVQILANEISQRRGLIIVDEVTTGLGRTGAWYGFEHYALQPDIIALGKGLGNGYPVSAVALRRDVARRLEDKAFRYAQSHQNDPLGCAIAQEVIAVMRAEGLVERSNRVGAHFLRALEHLETRYDVIREVRGRGLMIGLEFDATRCSVISVFRELVPRGFIVGCKPVASILRFYPALIIEEDDIAQLVENLDHIVTTQPPLAAGL